MRNFSCFDGVGARKSAVFAHQQSDFPSSNNNNKKWTPFKWIEQSEWAQESSLCRIKQKQKQKQKHKEYYEAQIGAFT